MTERFKIYLDKEREINIRIDGKEFRLPRYQVEAIIYESHRILEIQREVRAMDWKPNYIEEEIY